MEVEGGACESTKEGRRSNKINTQKKVGQPLGPSMVHKIGIISINGDVHYFCRLYQPITLQNRRRQFPSPMIYQKSKVKINGGLKGSLINLISQNQSEITLNSC